METIRILKVIGGRLPYKQHQQDACYDCCARITSNEITLPPHETCRVPLGFCVDLPDNWEMTVRPRSGMSLDGIAVAVGTVDAGYRGEVAAVVTNTTEYCKMVMDGERIAQIAFRELPFVNLVEVAELPISQDGRGDKGFGSTGK